MLKPFSVNGFQKHFNDLVRGETSLEEIQTVTGGLATRMASKSDSDSQIGFFISVQHPIATSSTTTEFLIDCTRMSPEPTSSVKLLRYRKETT